MEAKRNPEIGAKRSARNKIGMNMPTGLGIFCIGLILFASALRNHEPAALGIIFMALGGGLAGHSYRARQASAAEEERGAAAQTPPQAVKDNGRATKNE